MNAKFDLRTVWTFSVPKMTLWKWLYKEQESRYLNSALHLYVTKNLQILMTEMCKTKNEPSPSFMQEIFRENKTHHNLQNSNEFAQPRVRSVSNGTEGVRFKGPQLWQMLPSTVRNLETLCLFNKEIKDWYRENCPCKLCLIFISNLGNYDDCF